NMFSLYLQHNINSCLHFHEYIPLGESHLDQSLEGSGYVPIEKVDCPFSAIVPALVINSLFFLLDFEPPFQIIEAGNQNDCQLQFHDDALVSSSTSIVWHKLQFALPSRHITPLQ